MGRKAKLTQQRRQLRRELADRTRAEHAEKMADPVVLAKLDELAGDDEVREIIRGDHHDQARRLYAAGWRIREEAVDGLGLWDHRRAGLRIVHSVCRQADGHVWAHTSLSRRDDHLPGWYELRDAHRLLYPGRAGIVIIPPVAEHFSAAEVHHVWTCLSADVLPDFRFLGAV